VKNKTLLLTKTLIRNGEGLNLKGSNTFAKISVLVAFAVVIPMIMFGIGSFVVFLMGVLRPIGQEGLIISMGLSLNSAIIFIFGLFYIISTYYFSSDVEYLLPLPLKPGQIVGAKFLVVTLYEYMTTAVFFLPFWVTYGVMTGSGVLYYLYGLIIFLLLPITPLALASVLIMVIMRFTNLSRYKDTVKVIGGLLGVFLGIGVNLIVQRFSTNMSQEEILALLRKGENSLLELSNSIFPTIKWGAKAMVSSGDWSGFLSFLIYIGFSLLVFLAVLLMGEWIYLRSVMGMSETGSRRHKTGSNYLEKEAVRGSVVGTYLKTELKLLIRTPIYFINCVIIYFLWPIFLFLPMIMQNPAEKTDMMKGITGFMADPEASGFILIGAFIFAVFMGCMNATTSTSISREGGELFIKKYIPVSYQKQLTAKVLSGFVLGLAAIIIAVFLAVLVFKLPVWTGLLILLTAWLPIMSTCISGLLIDLYNPKLDWDSEQKAVKQNVNVLYNMIAGVVPAGLTLALIPVSSNFVLTAVLLTAAHGLLCALLMKCLLSLGVRQFRKLEN
jgi:ABC-2 type transport system permease protein